MRASPMNCVPMTEHCGIAADDLTEDGFLGGRLRLRQPKSGHRAGHDAILLAAATMARPGERVVEFGAGVGAAGLALARRVAGIELIMLEIDRRLADLAIGNAALNGIAADVRVLDIAARSDAFVAAGLAPDSADAVLMNPPFNDPSRHRPSQDAARQLAHLATATTLQTWVHAARRLLRSGGALTLIWRADALGEVMAALSHGFGGIAILPVHSRPAQPAIRILVRAIKGGRAPLAILPGLILNDGVSCADILTGEAELPLATR